MKRVLLLVFLLIPIGSVSASDEQTQSWATLEFTELESGVNAIWTAHVYDFATTNSSEELIQNLQERNSLELGCCLFQNTKMEIVSSNIENLSISDGFASWEETYVLNFNSTDELYRLDIPVVSSDSLRIISPQGWQISSTMAPSWMTGLPHDLIVDRTQSNLPAMITLVLSENEPPEIISSIQSDLPWDMPIEMLIETDDVYLSQIECEWNLDSNPITLSQTSIDPTEEVIITITCTDEGGLQSSITTNHQIDMSPPSVTSIYGNNISCIDDECRVIEAPSETPLQLTLNVTDDLTEIPTITWTSNKSEEWSGFGTEINLSFWPTEGINTASTPQIEHVKRQPLHYWLNAEITDNSGRITILNLSLIIKDASPPNIIAEMLYNNRSSPISGEEFDVDLSQSWDMWDTYSDLQFQFNLDGKEIQRPFVASAGQHILRIEAQDSSGNVKIKDIELYVDPALGLDLKLVNANSEDGETRIELENHGSSEGWFKICHEQECVMGFTKGATWEGPAQTVVELESEAGWFEKMMLDIEWEDDQGNTYRETIDSGIAGEPPIPLSICLPLILILLVILILFVKGSNEEEES